MKLGRRTPAPTGRRRRISGDTAAGSNYAYRSQRSEEVVNTGRNVKRQAISKHGRELGQFWLQRFGLLILLIVVVAGLVNLGTLSGDVRVVTPSQSKTSLLREPAVYQAAATKLMDSTPINRTKLTIDTAGFARQFSAQFPEVASASLVLSLAARTPILYVEPAQPALILASHDGSYVIDTTGKVLLLSSQLSADSHLELPVVTDQSNFSAKVGGQALSAQAVQNIRAILGQLAAKGVTLSSLTLPPSSNELDATVADQPYQVKFNLESNDGRQQAGALLATQAELKRTNVVPGKYIDVRVPGRAYYQ